MTRGKLKERIQFAAKIPDIDALGSWLDDSIQNTLNSLTAVTKFQELKVPDHVVTLSAGTQLVTIPLAQHIDLDEIYYVPEGDRFAAYKLFYRKENMIVDEGRAVSIIRRGKTAFSLFPFSEALGTDQILFTYWAYPLLASDATEIPVEELVPTLEHELIAEVSLHMDSKTFGAHRQIAKEAHSRMFGAVDVNDT